MTYPISYEDVYESYLMNKMLREKKEKELQNYILSLTRAEWNKTKYKLYPEFILSSIFERVGIKSEMLDLKWEIKK